MDQVIGKRGRKSIEKTTDNNIYSYKQSRTAAFLNKPVVNSVEPKLLPSVALSLYDKAPQLELSHDQLICYGCEGGYRMARATHGIHRGAYFWEVEVLPPQSENSHVRIGWSTRQGELQSSVGFDQYSFGYRDLDGSRVHKSQRIDDYGDSFSVGDVIGCYISLDDNPQNNKIIFFKNGIDQGIAYFGEEIPPGVYFPAVSLYMKAAVRVNFGPTFIMKYDIQEKVNPVSELQPMNPEDRLVHEKNINAIRQEKEARLQQLPKITPSHLRRIIRFELEEVIQSISSGSY